MGNDGASGWNDQRQVAAQVENEEEQHHDCDDQGCAGFAFHGLIVKLAPTHVQDVRQCQAGESRQAAPQKAIKGARPSQGNGVSLPALAAELKARRMVQLRLTYFAALHAGATSEAIPAAASLVGNRRKCSHELLNAKGVPYPRQSHFAPDFTRLRQMGQSAFHPIKCRAERMFLLFLKIVCVSL